MTHYSRFWDCEKCGERQESIDYPRHLLCDRCDDRTRVPCAACNGPTNVTPAVLRANRATRAVHNSCVVIDDE